MDVIVVNALVLIFGLVLGYGLGNYTKTPPRDENGRFKKRP